MEQDTRFHELMRKTSKEARFEAKHKAMSQKRIGFEHFAVEEKDYSLDIILLKVFTSIYARYMGVRVSFFVAVY